MNSWKYLLIQQQKRIFTKITTMENRDYDQIFTKLLELFPNPDTELHFSTPFQLLIAVVLSAQTTDRQVNVVTNKLFLKIKEPKDVIKITEKTLEKQVSSVNYYKMKSKHIRETAKQLIELSKNKDNKLTPKEKECLDKY